MLDAVVVSCPATGPVAPAAQVGARVMVTFAALTPLGRPEVVRFTEVMPAAPEFGDAAVDSPTVAEATVLVRVSASPAAPMAQSVASDRRKWRRRSAPTLYQRRGVGLAVRERALGGRECSRLSPSRIWPVNQSGENSRRFDFFWRRDAGGER
jgi:hypothetical protein